MTESQNTPKIIRLSNGGILIYQRSKSKMSHLSVTFVCGKEAKGKIGLKHKLEHNIFNGTHVYSKEYIAKVLSICGVEYNAYTSSQVISLHGDCPTQSLKIFLDVGSSMCSCNYINKKMLDLEDKAIIEEMNMYKDENNSEYGIVDEHIEFLEKPSKKEQNLLGTEESIAKVTADDLIKYKKDNFVSENMVISVVSDLPCEEVVKMVEETYGKKIKSCPEKKNKFEKTKFYPNTSLFAKYPDKNNHTVEIAVSYPCKNNPAFFKLLDHYLNGFHGELIKELRTKHGLVYTSQFNAYPLSNDKALLNFYITTSNTKVNAVLDDLGKIITKLQNNTFTEQTLNENIRSIVLRDNAKSYAPLTPDNITQKYLEGYDITKRRTNMNNLTAENVNKLLKNTFKNANVLITLSGDLPENCYSMQKIHKMLGAKIPKAIFLEPTKYYLYKTGEEIKDEDLGKYLRGTRAEIESNICHVNDLDKNDKMIEQEIANNGGLEATIDKSLDKMNEKTRFSLLSELLKSLGFGAADAKTLETVLPDDKMIGEHVEKMEKATKLIILKQLLKRYNLIAFNLETCKIISLDVQEQLDDKQQEQEQEQTQEQTKDGKNTDDGRGGK